MNIGLTVDVLIWMIVGIALLSSEAFTGTFHLLFVGLAALVTACVASLGVTSTFTQLIVFAAFSFVSAILMRQRLVRQSNRSFMDINSEILIEQDLQFGQEAVVLYEGVPWNAINGSRETLKKGTFARRIKIEGPTLVLGPSPKEVGLKESQKSPSLTL